MSTLLNTELTLDDVNHLTEKKILARLGPETGIKPIGAMGLQSVLGLIDPKWKTARGERNPTLPKSFVLKIASPTGMLNAFSEDISSFPAEHMEAMKQCVDGFVAYLRPCHNTEVVFYEKIKEYHIDLPQIPKYYFGKPFEGESNKAFLAMEDLTKYQVFSPITNLTKDQVEQSLTALAQLQAKMMKFSDKDKTGFPHRNLSGLYEVSPDFALQLQNGIAEKIPHPAIAPLAKKFAEILPNIIKSEEIDKLPEKLGLEKVFVHGDFWPANLMWDCQNGETKLAKLIDFQMSYYGLAVCDIARLLNTSVDVESRRKNWKGFLEFYHSAFEKSLEKDQKMPFSVEQKAEAMGNLFGKFIAIYEDIISMHEASENL
ncbi:hypothetical protein WR25_02980 [Diploscapter pachys]|uniref:CHK kinase-like domain-containing protein n=1 Tax=Diploscapter pachys TaxID=2018661 RepID=A0A2A2K3S0_9BILA|nr:hypothetical protein WR25_02980 [Diploscapter pachys]